MGKQVTFNPFSEATASWIECYLRLTCAEVSTAIEQRELDDQIAALVPALVELRDGGHITLNAKILVDFASLKGFSYLASDERLTAQSRQRCETICKNLIVQRVVEVFGGH